MSVHASLRVFAVLGLAVAFVPRPHAQTAPTVNVVITADNAYGFGFGTLNSMSNYFGGVFNTTAGDIFNCSTGPETYTVAGAGTNDFLYIVTWSDDSVTQGVLGQFKSGTNPTIFTGAGVWQVYATGLDFDTAPGPTLAQINAQIASANAGIGSPTTTSVGFVGTVATPGTQGILVFGEDNTTASAGTCANPFPVVCATSSGLPNAIENNARWMWYQAPGSTCAFQQGNQREFLIFRLPINQVTNPPECFLLLGTSPGDFALPWSPTDRVLVNPELIFPITGPTDTPVFFIHPAFFGYHVYTQIYMDNPYGYPSDPWKLSNAIDTLIGVGSKSYGGSSGMTLWLLDPPMVGGKLAHWFSVDQPPENP